MSKKIPIHEQCYMKECCAIYDTCPMTLVHKLISGKWKILILWYLSNNTLRFNQLQKKLPDITQKMLTNQLRSLEDDGLVLRIVYPVVPPKVEYSLTQVGKDMLPLLESMYHFGITYSRKTKQLKKEEA